MNDKRPQPFRRALVALLSLQLAIGPFAPAFAQLTKLADEPVGFSQSAPPNIVLTVDDSTSMLGDYLPDYIIGVVPGSAGPVPGFCRGSDGEMRVACGYAGDAKSPGYIFSRSSVPYPNWADGNPPNAFNYNASFIPDWQRAWPAPVHSNALNRLYYDPAVTYDPPLKYDGTPYPNQTVFNNVVTDPWAAELKYDNLTATADVGMWCNSDWPNNANWNPKVAGGGTECRINGTDYSGIAGNAATAEYQYPWRKTAGGNNIKYFHITSTGGNWQKSLWCNASAAEWPKNFGSCTTTYTCPVGQTYTPPPPLKQSCFDQGVKTGCTGPTVYNPPGCNTNPKYGSPGPCVGPECLPCANMGCPTGPTGRFGRCRLAGTAPPGSGGNNAGCDCSGAGCTINPAHPACTPIPATGPGTCSGGAPPTPKTTCGLAGGGCGVQLYNPVSGKNDGPTMLADANNTGPGGGLVCRRNNQSYAGGPAASPFNYPSGLYTSQVTSGCPSVSSFAQIRRHYWKTSVEWCVAKITTANDKWKGFGQAGACQDDHDLAHPYPRFYKYGVRKTDPEYLDNYANPAFERVDLDPATPTFTHTFYRAGVPVTISRTYVEEMTNYANWFSYYRTRIQAAKTVISRNFTHLDDTYRVGFHTLDNPPGSFANVNFFDNLAGGQKDIWYQKLFGIQIKMGKQTPNMDSLVRIGELYKNGTHPALAGATDPIILSCQKNYHMLFTDGITNQPALPTFTVGNVDDIVPALPQPIVDTPPVVAGSPWPELYRENTAAAKANTMADYAMHYWVTDLRPGMINDVTIGRDPAPWQHVNFAALSLGTEGTLAGASPPAVEAQIAAGAVEWPTPVPNQWQPNATGVEDLWHAAVNSRGRFVNAKTSQQLGRGIAAILADIASAQGSAVGATFANPNISATNNFSYIAKFEQGWGGVLQKIQIDPLSGATVGVIWDAKTQLIAQTTPAAPPNHQPWYTARRIVTVNEAGAAVPFLPGSLGPTQLATLGPDLTYQTSVIEYLRGRRDNEGDLDGQFRIRPSPLGDIVDSQAAVVFRTDAPNFDLWPYLDANDPGYSAFVTSQYGRPGRIYIGAGDGMLHAFDDATGNEAWAFVPRDFYRSAPPISNDKAGLIGLTYQPGGLPIYDHRFYVNASPRIVDADLAGTWRSLLVNGLGKGGKGYFALDVSSPGSVVDEASAASKFLWEFRHADLGFTYGRATIMKTRAFGGQWLVIVPSGYNNASGEGKLFFLRASDGTLLKTMSTNFGTPGNPSGLAHVAGYTKDYRNQVAEQFYAGDLFGNLWRFDTSDPDDTKWTVQKFAYLTDPGGAPQPITTPPRIDIDVNNAVDRWVFVGTGRLLHIDDLPSTQPQRMYALRDGTFATPSVIAAPLTVADLDLVSGIAGLGPSVVSQKGWYDDLPVGERIVKTPAAAVGLIAYVSTSQPIDPCQVGLPANIYVRQFGNGESRLDPGAGIVEFIYEPTGAAGVDVIATVPPGCMSNCVPDIKLAVLSSSTSQLLMFKAKLPSIVGERRMSWGTLGQ